MNRKNELNFKLTPRRGEVDKEKALDEDALVSR